MLTGLSILGFFGAGVLQGFVKCFAGLELSWLLSVPWFLLSVAFWVLFWYVERNGMV